MSTTTQRSTVVGVFHDRDDAREAVQALKDAGFAADTISILSPDKDTTEDMARETGTHAGSGAATGAVTGGVLGGLGGWLVGIGALAIPGVGPFIAAGAFATALAGAAVGAGVGAIAGALVGMGVPKEEADYYEGEVKSGGTLVTVRAEGRYDEAQGIMRQRGAYDIESRGGSAVTAQSTRQSDIRTGDGGGTMQLREEELQTRKTSVETGAVTLGKDVVEERKTLDVPVTREEVYVDRQPVERRPSDSPIDSNAERTINVPVREEQVELQKQPVVYEEVAVGKQQVVENRPISETVRREELRVDRHGDVDMAGATAGRERTDPSRSWDQVMPTYRQRWQQRSGASGGRWEDYEPGYRYGYELRGRSEYRGQSWSSMEPELERDWTQRNPTTPWARVRDSVRESLETDESGSTPR